MINIHGSTPEELIAHPYAGTLLEVYKIAQERDIENALAKLAPQFYFIDSRGGSDFVLCMLKFILDQARKKHTGKAETIVKIVKEMVTKQTGEKMMTFSDELRDEGRQEGIQLIAKNLLKKGLTEDFIAETTELSIEEINKLKKVLDEA